MILLTIAVRPQKLIGARKMNERIRELAEQAEDWADNQNFYASDYRDYLMEKFAELIVRDCIAQVRKDENGPAYEAAGRIAEHFGIED